MKGPVLDVPGSSFGSRWCTPESVHRIGEHSIMGNRNVPTTFLVSTDFLNYLNLTNSTTDRVSPTTYAPSVGDICYVRI